MAQGRNPEADRRRRGAIFLLCGLAAALLLPILVFEFRIGFPLAALAVVVGFVALAAIFTPRAPALPDDRDITRATIADTVLREAASDLGRLVAARDAMADATTRARIESLAGKGEHIIREVGDHPDRLCDAQRVLTYYLPRAADLADHIAACERLGRAGEETALAARAMLARLDDAFSATADAVAAHDDQAIAIDLKLLESSLRQDLRNNPPDNPPDNPRDNSRDHPPDRS